MKDHKQCYYPNQGGEEQRTQDSLRKIAKEASDSASPQEIDRFLESMPARSLTMVDLDGGLPRY